MSKTIVRGHQKKHRGTSCFNCCLTTSSASRQNLSAVLLTSLQSVAQASKNSSMAHSHFRQTATRWLARSKVCLACGRHVQLWLASRKAAAWAYRLPTGWSMATRAQIFGVWMSLATVTSPLSNTRMQKYARTIRVAFASRFRTKNLQQHDLCTRHRFTIVCLTTMPSWVQASASNIRCGFKTKTKNRSKMSPSTDRMRSKTSAKSRGQFANVSAFLRHQTSPNIKSVARAQQHGYKACSPTPCQKLAAQFSLRCSTPKAK